MLLHNETSFIKELYMEVKEKIPDNLFFFRYNQPDFQRRIDNFLVNKDVKFINQRELILELKEQYKSMRMSKLNRYDIDTSSSFDHISFVLKEALKFVSQLSPWIYELYNIFEIKFVPFVKTHQFESLEYMRGSGTTSETFDFIYISCSDIKDTEEYDAILLASSIAHEIAHHVLHLYQYNDDLILNNQVEAHSLIRMSKRPIVACLHALVASSYILEIFKRYKSKNLQLKEKIDFYSNDLICRCQQSILEITEKAQFTEIGGAIFNETKNNIQKYSNLP